MPTVLEAQVYAIVLGRVIARKRRGLEMSQTELAYRVCMLQSTLSRVESGRIDPSPFFFRQISEALRSTPAELQAEVDRIHARTQKVGSELTDLWGGLPEHLQEALPGLVDFLLAAEG